MISSPSNWNNFDPTERIQGLIKFFTFVGIWRAKRKCHYLYIIYGILFQSTFSYVYTGFEVANVMYVTSIAMLTEAVFVGLAEISMCIRMTNFVINFDEANVFLNRIKSFKLHNQEECDLYKKKLSQFSTVMKFYICCGLFAISFSSSATLPLFNKELKLPYPSAYPWDWKNDMVSYWILYAYQFVGIIFLAMTLIGLENFQIFCMICVGAQIDILGMRLRNIGHAHLPIMSTNSNEILPLKQRGDMNSLQTLLDCVREHKILMNFVSDIERVFNIPFLFQLFCSSVIFCLTGYQIMMMKDPSNEIILLAYYICFYATMMNEIFLPCYFGTQLTSINDGLLTAAYSSNWPEQSQSFKKTIILFMEYLQRPKIMMSGKIFTLTLFSFLTVINRSYSLFAVIRNVVK